MNKGYVDKGRKSRQYGFTLIEIAIGMLIIGVIITPVVILYNINFKQGQFIRTQDSFREIEDALIDYVEVHEKYPMPSRLIDSEGIDGYGKSVSATALPPICPDMSIGVCVTDSLSTGTPLAQGDVVIGWVPFADLNLEEKYAYDAWGSKLYYAVSVNQAVDDSVDPSYVFDRLGSGGVRLQAIDSTNTIIELAGPMNYTNFQAILISAGPNRKGAYNENGIIVETCVEITNPEAEDENCDHDNFFLIDANRSSDPLLLDDDTGTRNLNAGTRFYDDYTFEIREIGTLIWDNNENDNEVVVTAASRLGIGEQSPEVALHVRGDIRVTDDGSTVPTEGRLLTTTITDGTRVFDVAPTLITGNNTNMHCFNKTTGGDVLPVIGMGNSRTFCASPTNNSGTPILNQPQFGGGNFTSYRFDTSVLLPNPCPTNSHRLTGFDASGAPQCVLP